MKSLVKQNLDALEGLLTSMQTALQKARNGSDVEDMYFLEKFDKAAHLLSYKLTSKLQ